uniref:Tr-type G domain-containing protein n=1 Tax=Aegilops tauschii subsp. strangulata TaxID=200361 RepID=A0A453SEU8_AEGTS
RCAGPPPSSSLSPQIPNLRAPLPAAPKTLARRRPRRSRRAMDDSLYDEFGNYIGPELADSDADDSDAAASPSPSQSRSPSPARSPSGSPNSRRPAALMDVDDDDYADAAQNAVVLAEDKKYYPTAEEVYGPGVEALVMDEDEQALEKPIVAPPRVVKFEVGTRAGATSTYASTDFILGLASNPLLVRNVALVGHLQHGKTVFMDMLVEQTHEVDTFDSEGERHIRFTDTRVDEQERRVSIKAVPMSLVLESGNGKSYLCNIMDTPGHVNFSDEMTAALRLADGAVLVVDAAEGVMVNTERAIRHAIQERLPIVVVINKVHFAWLHFFLIQFGSKLKLTYALTLWFYRLTD